MTLLSKYRLYGASEKVLQNPHAASGAAMNETGAFQKAGEGVSYSM